MKIKYIYLLIALMIVGLFTSCNEDDWLQRTPKDRITDEQLWNDPNMILGLLANYYDRLPQLAGVFNTGTNAEFDEDRKSTRLNSSHVRISYAVFCLKKKTRQ